MIVSCPTCGCLAIADGELGKARRVCSDCQDPRRHFEAAVQVSLPSPAHWRVGAPVVDAGRARARGDSRARKTGPRRRWHVHGDRRGRRRRLYCG
jgi:hypothetical protein